MRNLTDMIDTEEDDAPILVSSVDITLVSDILNRALNVSNPKRSDRRNYMRSFNVLQNVPAENLRAANNKNRSAARWVNQPYAAAIPMI